MRGDLEVGANDPRRPFERPIHDTLVAHLGHLTPPRHQDDTATLNVGDLNPLDAHVTRPAPDDLEEHTDMSRNAVRNA